MLFVLFVVVRPIKLIEFTTVSPWLTQNWIDDFSLTHTHNKFFHNMVVFSLCSVLEK